MKWTVVIECVTLCTLLGGCQSKELSRDKAKAMIEASDTYKLSKHQVALTIPDANSLVGARLLQWHEGGFFSLELTQTGKKYIDSAGGSFAFLGAYIDPTTRQLKGGLNDPIGDAIFVVPSRPVRPVITQITGITGDSPAEKVVEYDWKWDLSGQPAELRTALARLEAPQHDSRRFKQYDDGWRIEQ